MKRRNAFTLTELLVAVALGSLSAVARLSNWAFPSMKTPSYAPLQIGVRSRRILFGCHRFLDAIGLVRPCEPQFKGMIELGPRDGQFCSVRAQRSPVISVFGRQFDVDEIWTPH